MLNFIAVVLCLVGSFLNYCVSLYYVSHDINKAIYFVLLAILMNLMASLNNNK
jgi:hypothetical protein